MLEPVSGSKPNYSSDILRSLGLYRASFAAVVVFTSICFRVIVGVMNESLRETVALVTAIEWGFNMFLEVPGGLVADKFGRARTALFGFSLFALGLFSSFLAITYSEHRTLAYVLLIADGICFGIGRPIVSGTVEAFYQDALHRQPDDAQSRGIRNRSFTLSNKFGPLITTGAVLAAFGAIYIFQNTVGVSYLLALGGLLYAYVMWRLYLDEKKYGENMTKLPRQLKEVLRQSLSTFIQNRKVNFGTFLITLFHVGYCVVAGYLIISVGRHFQSLNESTSWLSMFIFMLGFSGFGWIAKAVILPRLIEAVHEKACLNISLSILLAWSLLIVFLRTWLETSGHEYIFIGALTMFGITAQLAFGAIQGIGTNILLSQYDKKTYATGLSLSNMPGYLCVVLISLYFWLFQIGAPSISLALKMIVSTTIIGLLVNLSFFRNSSSSPDRQKNK